jgi:protein-disulfide isomerase
MKDVSTKGVSWIVALVVGFAFGFGADRLVGGKAGGTGIRPTAMRPPPGPQAPPPPPATPAAKVAFRPDDPVRGPENAKVTIVLFSDFQCPFCARVEPTLKQMELNFKNEIRIVWKHMPLPFHPNARPAAEAAEAAREQGKFWEMHDQLFENQRLLGPSLYESAAKNIGLDMAKFKAAVAAHSGAARIDEDVKQGSAVGANATPSLFVNCRLVSGAYPYDSFKPILDEEVKKADALIAQGKSGAALYDALCAANVKEYPAPKVMAGSGGSPAPGAVLPGGRAAVAVRHDDPAVGKPAAPVTVVEFSDFQCPFCQGAVPAVKDIEKAYPQDVRIVWKHLPLPMHPNAKPAAVAAEAARAQGGSAKFWAMHDKLFGDQRMLNSDQFAAYAKQLGLDVARFKRDLADPKLLARIEEDAQLAQKLGVNGTPTFIVNGEKVVGSAALRPAVDRMVAQAKSQPQAKK